MKKKLFGIVGLVAAGLVLTACGGSKGPRIVCSAEAKDENGDTQKSEVVAYLKDDKVSDVDSTITFATEDQAKSYYAMLEWIGQMGGTEIKAEQSGKVVTIKNMADLLESSEDESQPKIIGMTKDEFLDYAKSMGDEDGVQYNCEVK